MAVKKIYLKDDKFKNVRFATFVSQKFIYEGRKRIPSFDVYTISTAEEGNLEIEIPVSAGHKTIKFRTPIELVNPYLETVTTYVGEDDNRRAFVDYVLKAEDMKVKV